MGIYVVSLRKTLEFFLNAVYRIATVAQPQVRNLSKGVRVGFSLLEDWTWTLLGNVSLSPMPTQNGAVDFFYNGSQLMFTIFPLSEIGGSF